MSWDVVFKDLLTEIRDEIRGLRRELREKNQPQYESKEDKLRRLLTKTKQSEAIETKAPETK